MAWMSQGAVGDQRPPPPPPAAVGSPSPAPPSEQKERRVVLPLTCMGRAPPLEVAEVTPEASDPLLRCSGVPGVAAPPPSSRSRMARSSSSSSSSSSISAKRCFTSAGSTLTGLISTYSSLGG